MTIDTDLQNGLSDVADACGRDCADTPVHSFKAGIKEEGDARSGPSASEPIEPKRPMPAASTGIQTPISQLADF